jgi:glutamine synthetase
MESLDKDRDFLTEGNVFTDDQIDAYIALNLKKYIILNMHLIH